MIQDALHFPPRVPLPTSEPLVWFRLLVTGGREYRNEEHVAYHLQLAWEYFGDTFVVCHGGAPGADSLAGLWCSRNGVPCISMIAPWHAHPRTAGPIRNRWLLLHLQPDAVLAFPGGKGTSDMKNIARQAGVPVYEA